jgi:hypothetical protein
MDQRIRDALRIALEFEREVDPFHPKGTVSMGAGRIIVMDAGRCHGAKSTLAIKAIQGF